MKQHSSIRILIICSILAVILVFVGASIYAAEKSAAPAGSNPSASPGAQGEGAGFQEGLSGSYIIDFLEPENAPDKTLTINHPEGAAISASWVDPDHGYQELTNVSFDGEVLTFNALSGSPGDEYFYFHLNLYGSYLVGYAKTLEMPKSPVVGKPAK